MDIIKRPWVTRKQGTRNRNDVTTRIRCIGMRTKVSHSLVLTGATGSVFLQNVLISVLARNRKDDRRRDV